MARKTKSTHLVELRERQTQLAAELQAAEDALAFDIGRKAIEQGLEKFTPQQIQDALVIGKLSVEAGLSKNINKNEFKTFLSETITKFVNAK